MKQLYFLLTLAAVPSRNVGAWNPLNDPTVREYAYISAIAVSSGTLLYTWLKKRTVHQELDAYKKRFKNQELLSDSYDSARAALADYKDYVEIIERNGSQEQAVVELCQQLSKEFSQKTPLLQAFRKTAIERKLELEKKSKEIDRAICEWHASRKKALLTQQGPFLQSTYTLILTTLSLVHTHIGYVEASFFMKEHQDMLTDVHNLEKYLSDDVQCKYHLNKLIRTKARVGERYPFRAYAQWVDHYYDLISDIKKELEHFSYYSFQQPVITGLNRTYMIFDLLKKEIKVSPEYEAECAQYTTELLAHTRDDENRKLKQQLAHMKDEIHSLQNPAEPSEK